MFRNENRFGMVEPDANIYTVGTAQLPRINRSPTQMNARTLGISLAVGWMILPFIMCTGALVMPDDGFSLMSMALSAFMFLPFIAGTAIYTVIAAKHCMSGTVARRFPRLVLFLPFIGVAVWAVVANTKSRRITPDSASYNSPFDKGWFSAPQTVYGSPLPFLRFFDDTVPDARYPSVGATLFDIPTLLGDLAFWSFIIYVVVSLMYAVISHSRRGEPVATEPES